MIRWQRAETLDKFRYENGETWGHWADALTVGLSGSVAHIRNIVDDR